MRGTPEALLNDVEVEADSSFLYWNKLRYSGGTVEAMTALSYGQEAHRRVGDMEALIVDAGNAGGKG